MDDQRFDKAVRGKIGEYSDPAFDEGAVAGLHHQLDAYAPNPWYAPYKGAALMAATLGVFTLINWFMISSQQPGETQNAAFVQSKAYEATITELRGELAQLQTARVDTVYISAIRTSTSKEEQVSGRNEINSEEVISAFLLRLRDGEEIGELGDYYFVLKDDLPGATDFIALNNRQSTLDGGTWLPHRSYSDTIYKTVPQGEVINEPEPVRMPMVVVRDMEKHYARGLGIRIGGELELAMNLPDHGSGEMLPGGGILAEWVFSPSLALETGVKYKTRSYEIDTPDPEIMEDFPNIDPSNGQVQELESDAQLLEFPFNLKYYRPVAQFKDLYISLGVSPNLYLSQSFEYGFESPEEGENTLSGEGDVDGAQFHIGTFNAGMGMSFDLPKKRMAQVGLFYQRDIGGLGVENLGMNIVGIKSSYWFRVR